MENNNQMDIFSYYKRKEVSNSDLGWLKSQLQARETISDPYLAYRFGNLLDVIITEPHRADFFKYRIEDEIFTKKEWKTAELMKRSFLKDDYCRELIKNAEFQKVTAKEMNFNFQGIEFKLPTRIKWDILRDDVCIGCDIKTTIAKTQSEFESAIDFFDWDRQAAWYMDIENVNNHVIIGISKHNHKVFKIFINRRSDLYLNGKDKYSYLAYKWWLLFGENLNR